MNKLKKTISLLLCLIVLFSVVCFAATTEQIAAGILPFIVSHEGNYNDCISDDNGALSFGLLGWHGVRAKALLLEMIKADDANAKKLLGDTLYKEIKSDKDWSERILKDDENKKIKKLIATAKSKTLQDKYALTDVTGYVKHIKAYGITNDKAIAYLADFENQQGGSETSKNIGHAIQTAKHDVKKVTLDIVYACTKTYFPHSRRDECYKYCKELDFSKVSPEPESEQHYDEELYITTAESGLNFREKPDSSSKVILQIPFQTTIAVQEISGGWAKLTYKGKTGYVSTEYLEKYDEGMLGDINFDKKVDSKDARLALRASAHLEKLTDIQSKRADVNKDGMVNAKDARSILRFSARLDKTFK